MGRTIPLYITYEHTKSDGGRGDAILGRLSTYASAVITSPSCITHTHAHTHTRTHTHTTHTHTHIHTQMLLILQMIVENDGKVDRVDFAKRLYHWMQHGYKELGGGCRWVVSV